MLGTGARHGSVGVEVFQWYTVVVVVRHGCGPVDKIVGSTALYSADAFFRSCAFVQIAAEEAITFGVRVPQGDVDRVEFAFDGYGAFTNLGPVQPVGRSKAVQIVLIGAADGLIALVWLGAGVDEDAEVVGGILAQDEVVVGAAIVFD